MSSAVVNARRTVYSPQFHLRINEKSIVLTKQTSFEDEIRSNFRNQLSFT